jgi:type IV secretion system protein VirB6
VSGCPDIAVDGTAGIAAALRSVDCMTTHTTGFAFGRLFGSGGVLLPALTILLTLYVASFAVGLLTGRARLGIGALTPRMLRLGMVLTFATSWVAYQGVVWSLATGAPDQIASILVGTHGSATEGFANRLDALFGKIADAAAQASSLPDQAHKAAGFSPADLLWISALMLLLGTVGVLVTARVALAALLALGPVFIVFALFRATRGLFEGWLKVTVLFACVPLFTVLIGGPAIALLVPMVETLDSGNATLRAGVTLFVGASVYCALTFMALKVAATLVSGWRLPLAGGDREVPHTGASGHPPQTIRAMTGGAIPATAYRDRPAGQDRVREMMAGLPGSHPSSPATVALSRDRTIVGPPPVLAPSRSAFDPRIRTISGLYRRSAAPVVKETV